MNIILIIFLITIFYILTDLIKKNRKFSKNDPPGFKYSFPIIGDLFRIGKLPHRSFNDIEKKFKQGIFKLWMGDKYTVVLTDVDMMNEFLVKKGNLFINRPKINSFRQWSYGGRGLVMADGDDWRRVRNLTSSAFSKTRVNKISGLIEDQVTILIRSLKEYSDNDIPLYPKPLLAKYTMNIVGRLFFSKDVFTDQDIKGIEKNTKRLLAPILKVFNIMGIGQIDDLISLTYPFLYFKRKDLQNSINEIYNYIHDIYYEHLENFNPDDPKDIMDILINDTESKDERMVIITAMDLLLGGSHTSESTIQFFLLKIIEQPLIQKKIHQEIIQVFGNNCNFIYLEDIKKLPYLNSCLNEVLRCLPITPLSIPRTNTEDTTIGGYFIPKGTQVIPNLYGMSNSEKYVENPSLFNPDRWLEKSNLKNDDPLIDKYFNNLNKVSIPFSLGVRGCPAYFLAVGEICVACANMILSYTFESYDGTPIDQKEEFGLTVYPKFHQLKVKQRKK